MSGIVSVLERWEAHVRADEAACVRAGVRRSLERWLCEALERGDERWADALGRVLYGGASSPVPRGDRVAYFETFEAAREWAAETVRGFPAWRVAPSGKYWGVVLRPGGPWASLDGTPAGGAS